MGKPSGMVLFFEGKAMTDFTNTPRLLAVGLVVIVCLLGAVGGPAQAEENAAPDSIDPSEIPSVHNTFYKVPEGVLSWDILGDMDVEVEVLAPLRTVFDVKYSEEIEALDRQQVKIMGFLFPLEGGATHDHFLLSAWPPGCPYCLPAGPSQMVEVFCDEPIEFSEGAILMAGTFEVLHDDPSGMFYRMQDATLVERFDDIRWTGELTQ
jgi:hypothetical protein